MLHLGYQKMFGAGIVKTPTLFNQHVINIHQNDFENEHVFAVLKVFPDDQYTWHTHTHESKLVMHAHTHECRPTEIKEYPANIRLLAKTIEYIYCDEKRPGSDSPCHNHIRSA